MTTDNRTNEPTEAQVERAAIVLYERGWHGTRTWDRDATEVGKIGYRNRARAALVAAAGAAPQAESETIIGAVMRTSSMACHIALAADGMAESHGAGCGHVPILTPAVQQVSESDLAEVIARHRVTAGRPGLPVECLCNWRSSLGDESHATHVARAVVAALGGESRG